MATSKGRGYRIDWRGKDFSAELENLVRARLAAAGEFMRAEVVKKLSAGSSRTAGPSSPGQPPHADTGQLRRSINWTVIDIAKGHKAVRIGTSIVYGRIQELGGVVKATRRYLTVPVSKKAKRHRGPASKFKIPLTLIPRPGKDPLLVEVRGTQIIPHYVLKPSVRLPARPYLRPTYNENKNKIKQIIQGPKGGRGGGRVIPRGGI